MLIGMTPNTASTDQKVHENRLRRMAARQRFALHKSRRRDRLATDYGELWLREIDCPSPERSSDAWHGPFSTLAELEKYLANRPAHTWTTR
jgi:hypothetical protein